MTDILQKHNATIDKYIGDAIVAFWNAPLDDPKHIENSANAILEMQQTLTALNHDYPDQSEFIWPGEVGMGLGLNTGMCCVGNLGSEQRFSYSMIGDAANLASRIEGLTKYYGLVNLVGVSTANELGEFAILEMDIVSVVGRNTAEPIYTVLGNSNFAETTNFSDLKTVHESFIINYRNQAWERAESIAQELITKFPSSGLNRYYAIMIDRINGYKLDPPPEDWGGIYHATSK